MKRMPSNFKEMSAGSKYDLCIDLDDDFIEFLEDCLGGFDNVDVDGKGRICSSYEGIKNFIGVSRGIIDSRFREIESLKKDFEDYVKYRNG